jgi:hypothetical protein
MTASIAAERLGVPSAEGMVACVLWTQPVVSDSERATAARVEDDVFMSKRIGHPADSEN